MRNEPRVELSELRYGPVQARGFSMPGVLGFFAIRWFRRLSAGLNGLCGLFAMIHQLLKIPRAR